MEFSKAYAGFLAKFGKGRHMVLSTSKADHVTSRMMSIVQIDGLFYFQTDMLFRKYIQLKANPHAALCIENTQIEGICEEIGHPKDQPVFIERYHEVFPGSYDRYSSIENERVFTLKPTYIECWRYIDGEPYMEIYDCKLQKHCLIPYNGK